MNDLLPWIIVLACVALSTLCDTTSTMYWEKKSWLLFFVTLFASPLVFLCFGYVGSKYGLSVASSLTNSLVVIGPILVGLLVRQEWKSVSLPQIAGMVCIILGITLIVIFKSSPEPEQ